MEKTHIILTVDGGKGHNIAAEVWKDRLIKAGIAPDKIIIINITKEKWLALGGPFSITDGIARIIKNIPSHQTVGEWGAEQWNDAQKNNKLDKLNEFIEQQSQADRYFAESITKKMEELLTNNPNVIEVIITQPMGVATIAKVIAEANKKIKLKIIFTDLLTDGAVHFINATASLDPRVLANVEIEIDLGPVPYLLGNPTTYDLHCVTKKYFSHLYKDDGQLFPNITLTESDGPIKDEFIQIKQEKQQYGAEETIAKYREKPITLHFIPDAYEKINTDLDWLNKALLKTDEELVFKFKLPEQADVISIMLGSQAAIDLTINLLNLAFAQYLKDQKPLYIFTFCGEDNKLIPDANGKTIEYKKMNNLFVSVCDIAKDYHAKTKGKCCIIPLSNQQADTISHLFCISASIHNKWRGKAQVRPGGLTTAQIIATSADAYFFGALVNGDPLAGFIPWEKGNALGATLLLPPGKVVITNIGLYTLCEKTIENTNGLPSVIDPKVAACLTQDLLAYCAANTLQASNKYSDLFTIGCAIFMKNNNHVSLRDLSDFTRLSYYGHSYYQGCDKFLDKKQLIHPCSFAIKFADYVDMAIKESIQTDNNFPLTSIYLNSQYGAEIYAKLFYEKRLYIDSIPDSKKLFTTIDTYLNMPSEDEINDEKIVQYILNKQKEIENEAQQFVEISQSTITIKNPDEKENTFSKDWDDAKSIIENCIAVLKKYIPGVSLYIFSRNNYFNANKLIDELNNLKKKSENTSDLDKEIIELITNATKNSSIPNKEGEYMQRLNYLIKKINYLIETKHTEKPTLSLQPSR